MERQLFFLLQKSGFILISTAEFSLPGKARLLTSSNWFLCHRVQIRGSSAIDQFKLVSTTASTSGEAQLLTSSNWFLPLNSERLLRNAVQAEKSTVIENVLSF